MALIPQYTYFNRSFILVKSGDHVSPLLGAQPIVLISKNGAPFGTPDGTVTEIGNGWYNISFSSFDTNTLGMLSIHITAPNADPTDIGDEVIQSQQMPDYIPPVSTVPSIQGYIDWIRTIMGVTADVLPDDSPYIQLSYDMATEWVNIYLNLASPLLYTQCIYNLGGAMLVGIAQDIPPSTFWTDMRTSLGLNNFIPGFVNAANDEDTSAAVLVPVNLQNLTIADLQLLKTPWGRFYLSIAQSVGSMWGLTM
jgi:hypothetical protein